MDKLLSLLDFSCIDPMLYWRIETRTLRVSYEIQWRRGDKFHWRLRKVGGLFWELSSDSALVKLLEAHDIDSQIFEAKLRNSLLQQVTYADRIVQEARALLGSSQVDEAISEQKIFLSLLDEAIQSFTPTAKPKRPSLRIVDEKQKVQFSP